MAVDPPLLALLTASLLGALLGCATGLIPGIHSNNAASMVGGQPGLFLTAATVGALAIGDTGWSVVASAAVVSCAVAHTVTNIVPSVYLAVPEDDTALSVLPGHRMVRAGRGAEALHISVTSSLASLTIVVVLVVPVHALLGPPVDLYRGLTAWIGPALLAVSTYMVLREMDKSGGPGRLKGVRAAAAALGVLVGAGALGHLALFEAGMVAPLFIGLFGIPTIIIAMMGDQEELRHPGPKRAPRSGRLPWASVLRGSLAGAVVGWFPGISSAQATILSAREVDGGDDDGLRGTRRFIAGVSAVNTANVVFNLVALATLLRVRSGATSAVHDLVGWTEPPWGEGVLPDMEVTMLLMGAVIGGLVAVPVALSAGTWMQRFLPFLSDRRTLYGIILILVAVPVATGGWAAGVVVVAASGLGMVPPLLGLMRVHLMGAVTLPLALGLVLGNL